jgi:hypothetical protein
MAELVAVEAITLVELLSCPAVRHGHAGHVVDKTFNRTLIMPACGDRS